MLDNKKSKAGMFHTHASDTHNKHILGATQKHDVANKHITSDVGSALLNASVFTCIHEYTTASNITHPDKYIELNRSRHICNASPKTRDTGEHTHTHTPTECTCTYDVCGTCTECNNIGDCQHISCMRECMYACTHA